MIMIDWVTAKIPFYYPGIISDGEVMFISGEGELQHSVRKRLQLRGSYDGSISIRTSEVDHNGNTSFIEFSGNPVKFLQGHNLFGSSDLVNITVESVLKIADMLNTPQPQNVLFPLYRGAWTVSRVDINRMYSLDRRPDVLSYLYSLSKTARTRSQAAVSKGSTVYFNKDSRRWKAKFYSKGQEVELKRNKKQGSIELPPAIKQWVDPMLRAELTLLSNELREHPYGLHIAANWNTIEVHDIYTDYMGRIAMAEQKTPDNLTHVIKSRPAAASYQMWLDGHDLRQILPRPTFYRHRTYLLENHSVDISIPRPSPESNLSNVVPFRKTLELVPATLPHWVEGTNLLFEPRKFANM